MNDLETLHESSVLFRLTEAVNRAGRVEEIYEPVLEAVVGMPGLQRAAILLYDPDGVMRFKAWKNLSGGYRAAVEGHSPWRRDDPDPRPVLVADVERDPEWEKFRPVFALERIRALAFFPIVGSRGLLGKLMVYADAPRRFTEHEIELGQSIASLISLGTLRLERETRPRRDHESERDLLELLCHDLRDPLSAILASSLVLSRLDPTRHRAERFRDNSEIIRRAAERMARLVDDAADCMRLRGPVSIPRAAVSADFLVRSAIEIAAPRAGERSVAIQNLDAANLAEVSCNGDRIVRVLSDLLSRAVEATPAGGQVDVGAEAKAESVVFWVRDHRVGIAGELSRLFELPGKDGGPHRASARLGLLAARAIIEAHGGRIWAESAIGQGTRFSFTLPHVGPAAETAGDAARAEHIR